MAAVPMRSAVALLGLTLLVLPALASSPAGSQTDPAGDQYAYGLDDLDGTPLRCRDPALDVVASTVTLDNDSVDIALTMDDLAAPAACGPVPLAPDRYGAVHVYMNYSCDTWCGETGHYLFVMHDLAGTTCVEVYSHGLGSSVGCTDLGGPATVAGNTLSWSIPRSGTYTDETGTTSSYAFNGPLTYYGVTYSENKVAVGNVDLGSVTLEDQYAW